jgi:hypothetical protein
VQRVLAAAAGLLMSLVLAAPAAAFTAPELFVRQQKWDTHEETGTWFPLASAPAVDYLGGYQIGYRLQDSAEPNELQRVALTIAGVPDGAPTQPANASPYCVTQVGTVGDIVPAGPELQFEGNGSYSVKVSIGEASGGSSGCLSGPSTTGSFSVGVRVTPVLAGTPLTFRASPLAGDPFVGVQVAAAPPGGQADVRCALDGALQPDGSITGAAIVPDPASTHPSVVESVFTRPGAWACFARGAAEGRDDNNETTLFSTPWSGPLAVEVRTDFRRRTGSVARRSAGRPRFSFAAEWPALARGGRARLTVSRVTGCRGREPRLRRVASVRGRFGAKRLRIAIRRPRKNGFFVGRLAFSGTRFVRAGTDPVPLLLTATRKRFGFSEPRTFPRCPGYRP